MDVHQVLSHCDADFVTCIPLVMTLQLSCFGSDLPRPISFFFSWPVRNPMDLVDWESKGYL